MNVERSVFIASSSLDAGTCKPVAEQLDKRGYHVIPFETDRIASGEVPFAFEFTTDGLRMQYGEEMISLASISAAWLRRPNMFLYHPGDIAGQVSAHNDLQRMQANLWDMVPDRAWLNQPDKIRRADHKLGQLSLARELGLDIPHTVVSNRWSAIESRLPDDVIFKSLSPRRFHDDGMRYIYTQRLQQGDAPHDLNPYPALWQPYVDKAREWRITLVGDEAFDVSIHTDEAARTDWREHQSTDAVTFRKGNFPDREKEKCFEFKKRLGLGFAIFEFIESSDGALTFLECNPNGQYGWLEDELGLPISDAITNELAKIADAAVE